MGELGKPQILTLSETPTDLTLFDCRWVPCSTRVVAAGTHTRGHGVLRVYSMADVDEALDPGQPQWRLKEIGSVQRPHPFKCVTFEASGLESRNPATGDFDGNLDVWDLEESRSVWSVKAHASIINAVDGIGGAGSAASSTAPELVTGSRDGSVKVWDVRVKDRPVACMQPQAEDQRRDCWSVAFGKTQGSTLLVAAGFDNGDVKLFDLRAMALSWEGTAPNGVCCVAFDKADASQKLLATCLEGRVHLWDLKKKTEAAEEGDLSEWTDLVDGRPGGGAGHRTIWGGRFLRQNRDLVVTMGGGGSLTLFKYVPNGEDDDQDKVHGKLEKLQEEAQVADQPISGFDWSPDKAGLAVTSAFDQTLRLVIFTKLGSC